MLENDKAKVIWDVPFHLEQPFENTENSIDMRVMDKGSDVQWCFIMNAKIIEEIFHKNKYAFINYIKSK